METFWQQLKQPLTNKELYWCNIILIFSENKSNIIANYVLWISPAVEPYFSLKILKLPNSPNLTTAKF